MNGEREHLKELISNMLDSILECDMNEEREIINNYLNHTCWSHWEVAELAHTDDDFEDRFHYKVREKLHLIKKELHEKLLEELTENVGEDEGFLLTFNDEEVIQDYIDD